MFNRRVGVCIIIFNYKHRSHLEIATIQRLLINDIACRPKGQMINSLYIGPILGYFDDCDSNKYIHVPE